MKKLFVSVPMKNRNEEDILKSIDVMHKLAELAFGQELEVINSYDPKLKKTSKINAISKSIAKMAKADYFIAPRLYETNTIFAGVEIEVHVAREYLDRKCILVIPMDDFSCYNDIRMPEPVEAVSVC